ncbi:hypothetical protein [Phytohabitans suffuscus]|nr:hypothetical protein [Phytohabitans suffuscus]
MRMSSTTRSGRAAATVVTTALLGIAVTKGLAGGVAVYGVLLLAVAVALYTRPVPAPGTAITPRTATAR